MKPEFEKYHLIDRFLRGELEGKELETFRRDLEAVPGFAEEVEFQVNVNELISVNSFHHLRQQMTREMLIRDQNASLKKWFGGGLGILALLLISSWFVLKNRGTAESGMHTDKGTDYTGRTVSDSVFMGDNREKKTGSEVAVIAPKHRNPGQKTDSREHSLGKPEGEILKTADSEAIVQDVEDKKTGNPEDSSVTTGQPDHSNVSGADKNIPVEDMPPADPCEKTVIKASWTVEKACEGQKNGGIRVDENSIKGGVKPYVLELFLGNSRLHGTWSDQLFSGNYTLRVTDAKGCTGSWDVRVEEKPCRPRNVSISPDHGESWEYYGNEGDSYYLSILDQSGQIVFRSGLLTGKTEWAGTSASGAPVNSGLYIYIIEYANGKKENGQITVIR